MQKLNWFQEKIAKWFLPKNYNQEPVVIYKPEIIEHVANDDGVIDKIILKGIKTAVNPKSDPWDRVGGIVIALLAANAKENQPRGRKRSLN